MKVIDHHCHLEFNRKSTVKDLTHYLMGQIIIATNEDMKVIENFNDEKWLNYFVENVNLIENTDYYKTFLYCLTKRYGIKDITYNSMMRVIKDVDYLDTIKEFEYILSIATSNQTKYDNVLSIHYCDAYIYKDFILNTQCKTVYDYFTFLTNILAKENKLVGLKFCIAYERTIDIKVYKYEEYLLTNIEDFINLKDHEDIVLNYLISYAQKNMLPIQIHCGMLEITAMKSADISRTNPLLLQEIISEYNNVNFVLLHCGFPFINQQISMAMMNPNVYIDFSWLSYMNQNIYITSILKAYSCIPVKKILAFGSDCANVFIASTLKDITIDLLKDNNISNSDIEQMMYRNIKQLYNLV